MISVEQVEKEIEKLEQERAAWDLGVKNLIEAVKQSAETYSDMDVIKLHKALIEFKEHNFEALTMPVLDMCAILQKRRLKIEGIKQTTGATVKAPTPKIATPTQATQATPAAIPNLTGMSKEQAMALLASLLKK